MASDGRRHIFLMDSGGGEQEHYSARTAEEAVRMAAENFGDTVEQYLEEFSVSQVADDEMLKVYLDEPYSGDSPHKVQTCREWADEVEGFVCSTFE